MIITIIGPRSIGKTSVSKLLAKQLNYKYISSDEEIDKKFKQEGGINAIFEKDNKDSLFIRANQLFNEVFSQDNIIFDLAGGSLSVYDSNGNSLNPKTITNNSIAIGLLPFKDDQKSIQLLNKREKTRPHWQNLDEEELLENTKQHYIEVKKSLKNHIPTIYYIENKTPEEIINDLIKLLK